MDDSTKHDQLSFRFIIFGVHREEVRTSLSDPFDVAENVVVGEVVTRSQINRSARMRCTNRTVRRRQFPMTAAYAFTDYRSQGQTLPCAIVDIATPPSGGLNLFNLYLALSRSAGRSSIHLLRNFDDEVFLKSHCNDLLAEDDRLEEENNKIGRAHV